VAGRVVSHVYPSQCINLGWEKAIREISEDHPKIGEKYTTQQTNEIQFQYFCHALQF